MNEKFMKKALALAENGTGKVSPNPLVGAVLVKNGRIIGEGWHDHYGGPHAEVNAIQNATESVSGCDLYVTLEPCCHHGKTPPCTDLIIENNIANVFVAALDPNPLVAGKGIQKLRDAGISVTTGCLKEAAEEQNRFFIHHITTGRPYVLMKSAMTADGKTATATGDSKWISGSASRALVHHLRHQVSAIMVGIGTLLADDPRLNTRLEDGTGISPTPIIVDAKGKMPADAAIIKTRDGQPILWVTGDDIDGTPEGFPPSITHIKMPLTKGHIDLNQLMIQLGAMGINSLLLEGGSELNASAIHSGIVDEVMAFIAPKILGGRGSKTSVGGPDTPLITDSTPLSLIDFKQIDDDIMIRWKVVK